MPGGFLNRPRRLAGSPATGGTTPLDFSYGQDGGAENMRQAVPMAIQGMLSGAAVPSTGGGPNDFFRAAAVGNNRVNQVKTEIAQKAMQDRQVDLEDIGVQQKLMASGRPVIGGMVEEEQLLPDGSVVMVPRPVDKSRVAKHKGRNGQETQVELYTANEIIDQHKKQKQAEEQAKVAAKIEETRQLQQLGETPSEVAKIRAGATKTAAEIAADAAAERQKAIADDAAARERIRAENAQDLQNQRIAAQAQQGDLNRTARVEDRNRVPTPAQEASQIRVGTALAGARAKAHEQASGPGEIAAAAEVTDPESGSILAQTGLSLPAFLTLTGRSASLPRDKVTRSKAFKEAQDWANKHGADVSTMGSQYKSYNDVLERNIGRLNATKIMEDELQGTIENLQQVAKDKDLGRLNFGNVAKIWAGQEVNDSLAQQYAMHLYQLRTELAAYGAATQGRTGAQVTDSDLREAETTIRNGIAKGSLQGLSTAIKNSTGKMTSVMDRSVTRARREVWRLFGVDRNFKESPAAGGGLQVGSVDDGYRFKGGDPADQNNWEKVQ